MSSNQKQTLVTGATGGIGKAVVTLLAERGHSVIATDLRLPRDEDRVPGVHYVACDVLDPEAVKQLVQEVPGGFLTGVVSAAGVAFFERDGSVFEIEEDVWTTTLGVNLEGTRLLLNAALPLLRAARAAEQETVSIVNIASIAGTHGMDSPLDAYQVSKAAVVSLSKSLAIQLGPEGIRCNTVCPGSILTPMIAHLYEESPARREDMELRTPLRRIGMPEDIAQAVAFLLSPEASFVTGTDLIVDGGWTAQIK